MKAAVVRAWGQAPRFEEFQDPQAGEGEVLVRVAASGLHPLVKSTAAGAHYSSSGELPFVPGVDGIGTLEDGTRVYFVFPRKPWGAMAELSVVKREQCFPIPESLDDATAAAIGNPGMSAWLSMKERAGLQAGDTVLINGATGVAGQVAIQLARHMGAGRIIATGRSAATLRKSGVDGVIDLSQSEDRVREAFTAEAEKGIDVVIDYLWGKPTEYLIEALGKGFKQSGSRSIRFVQVGDVAGKTISLAGAALRSIDLKLMGSGFGSVPLERVVDVLPSVFALAASGALTIEVDRKPLSAVEEAWGAKPQGRRIVFTM